MIDAGADLVVGHGPHVLRGMEFYKGRLIAYSLGNFAGGGKSLSNDGRLGWGGVLKVSLEAGRHLGRRLVRLDVHERRRQADASTRTTAGLGLVSELSRRRTSRRPGPVRRRRARSPRRRPAAPRRTAPGPSRAVRAT